MTKKFLAKGLNDAEVLLEQKGGKICEVDKKYFPGLDFFKCFARDSNQFSFIRNLSQYSASKSIVIRT